MTALRIALIHATPLAIDPIKEAFTRLWPEARTTHLLDLVESAGTRVVNRPAGVRALQEKLVALHFPELCPPTLVSADPAEVRRFVAAHGAAVVKPVDGFGGLDVWLLWALFQRNYFDARRSETLTLTDRDLVVERRSPDGEREEHRLDAYWLRFDVSEERLVVVSRGNRIVVGRFLSPEERGQLAEELKAAHARMRTPRHEHRWDN